MSVLYNQFCITEIVPDLKTCSIIIRTNFKIDPSSVNLKTVSLYDYDSGDRTLVDYVLRTDGKNIIIELKDVPSYETKFFLKVSDIYDALNRKLNYAYNNYIVFTNDVLTSINIISPGYRESFTTNTIDMKLQIVDPIEEGSYVIQVSADNAFYNIISTIIFGVTDEAITDNTITFKTTIEHEGQVFIRARAEKDEQTVGRWSEPSSFAIYTIPMDSMDTNFLEDSLTTYDLFPDDGIIGLEIKELEVKDKNKILNISDEVLYIEFNSELLLPEEYEVDEDGYVSLGVVTGFRKELK